MAPARHDPGPTGEGAGTGGRGLWKAEAASVDGPPDADAFDKLLALIEKPEFALEPPVNIDEANELARLWVIAMYELAGVPAAIDALFRTRETDPKFGDLSLDLAKLPAGVRQTMSEIIELRSEPFDTEQELTEEIRLAFNLGSAAVPTVNFEFAALYRDLAIRASASEATVDPAKVLSEDPAQAGAIFATLLDLKRAILRVTQNMSVYGTTGNARLLNKWSRIMLGSLDVLAQFAMTVVSADQEDRSVWSLLAAINGMPRETVTAYSVNGRDGSEMLRLAIGIYDAIHDGRVPAKLPEAGSGGHDSAPERAGEAAGGAGSEGRMAVTEAPAATAASAGGSGDLERDDDEFLRALFFSKGNAIFNEPLKTKVGHTEISTALGAKAAVVKDYAAPLWP